MRTRIAALAAALAIAVPSAAFGYEPDTAQQLAEVRRATARYHEIDRAISDGYRPASPCVAQMGYHYQRSVAADASQLDVTEPNMLVYAPTPGGALRLVAVEYASWRPASLFDRPFDPPSGGGPPFHTLHAWIWQANPDGLFAAHNANVSCHD